MTTARKNKHRKAIHAPRPGTLAAWVCEQSVADPSASPSELAKRARLEVDATGRKRFPNATTQGIYSARWQYGLTQARPLLADVVAADGSGTSLGTIAVASRVPPGPVPAEVLTVCARYGTDTVRRALAQIEARGAAILGAS